jgi:hypothetical protein
MHAVVDGNGLPVSSRARLRILAEKDRYLAFYQSGFSKLSVLASDKSA